MSSVHGHANYRVYFMQYKKLLLKSVPYRCISTKARDWLGRTSKWPILCRVGRKTST